MDSLSFWLPPKPPAGAIRCMVLATRAGGLQGPDGASLREAARSQVGSR